MKQKVKATVISQKELTTGIFDLWIKTDLAKEAHCGQFVGVYTSDASKLLPRPISICEVSDEFDALRLVYRVTSDNSGTALISKLKAGDEVDIIGILGNGYIFTDIFGENMERACGSTGCTAALQGASAGAFGSTECTAAQKGAAAGTCETPAHVILLGGGIGIPPMLQTAKELVAHGVKPTVIVGYRDKNMFLNQDLIRYGTLLIASEDGSVGTKGNVLNVVDKLERKPDIIMACGPMPMLRAIKRYAEDECNNGHNVSAYISLEERMACGVGACLGCVAKTKNVDAHSHVNNTRICTDGPVFNAQDVDI